LERTLLEIAADLDLRQLGRAYAAAERSGKLRWSELRRVITSGKGHAGIGRLRRVHAEADPTAVDARSGIEVDFLGLCRRGGLPAPAVNVLVEGHLVDFHWPQHRLVVELDSYRYHRGGIAFERDHETTLALESAGHRVQRFTERMLAAQPRKVLEQVRRSLIS
jgi:hypothetical protein